MKQHGRCLRLLAFWARVRDGLDRPPAAASALRGMYLAEFLLEKSRNSLDAS
jgi:hypothetical protein